MNGTCDLCQTSNVETQQEYELRRRGGQQAGPAPHPYHCRYCHAAERVMRRNALTLDERGRAAVRVMIAATSAILHEHDRAFRDSIGEMFNDASWAMRPRR